MPVGAVEKTWTLIVSRFRQRILGIAPKAAPLVAMEVTVPACHEIIETMVHEALAELANTPVIGNTSEAGPGGGDGPGDGGAATVLGDL